MKYLKNIILPIFIFSLFYSCMEKEGRTNTSCDNSSIDIRNVSNDTLNCPTNGKMVGFLDSTPFSSHFVLSSVVIDTTMTYTLNLMVIDSVNHSVLINVNVLINAQTLKPDYDKIDLTAGRNEFFPSAYYVVDSSFKANSVQFFYDKEKTELSGCMNLKFDMKNTSDNPKKSYLFQNVQLKTNFKKLKTNCFQCGTI